MKKHELQEVKQYEDTPHDTKIKQQENKNQKTAILHS